MTEKGEKMKGGGQVKHAPKDAQAILAILREAGVTDHEPRVLQQLLELVQRYAVTVLEEARVLATHARRRQVEADDVRLAVQFALDRTFTAPPPREVLLELARTKNVSPLPLIKPHCGLRLPPDRYCLSACNYKLKTTAKKVVAKPAVPTPSTMKSSTPKGNSNQQNVVMKRSNVMGGSKANVVPKPVLKFTSGTKVVTKPAVRVTSGPPHSTKMEVDEVSTQKRKRDDDDYDM